MNNKEKSIGTRGRTFTGIVISAKSQKTATVQWNYWRYIKKFERYVRLRSKVRVHNPETMNATLGDVVDIKECRPISKTKTFIIIEKRGKDYSYLAAKDQEAELQAVRDSKARKKLEEEQKGVEES